MVPAPYRLRGYGSILPVLLVCALLIGQSNPCCGQPPETVYPELRPANSEDYSSETGLSRICASDIYIDSKGRLWLNTCRVEKSLYSLPLVQFDGSQFIPANTSSLQIPPQSTVKFTGMSKDDELYGYYNRDNDVKTFFRYRLYDGDSELWPLEGLIPEKADIKSVYRTEAGEWLFFTRMENRLQIYRKDGNSLELTADIPMDFYPVPVVDILPRPVAELNGEIWFADIVFPLLRWNPETGAWKKYVSSDFPSKFEYFPRQREIPWQLESPGIAVHKGQLIVCFPAYTQNHFFRFDPDTGRFLQVAGLPDQWHAEAVFADRTGHVVYLFREPSGEYRAILEDQDGALYRYSRFVQDKNKINNLAGADFTRKVIVCTEDGIRVSTVWQSGSIRVLVPDNNIRAITEMSDGRLLVSLPGLNWVTIDHKQGLVDTFQTPSCPEEPFHAFMRRRVVTRPDASVWTYRDDMIIRFDPGNGQCRSYPTGAEIQTFAFMNGDSIACMNIRNRLQFLDLATGEVHPYLENGRPFEVDHFVQDIQKAGDGQLLLTTNGGLWMIDYRHGSSRLIGPGDGFRDTRLITTYENEEGRFWIGTFVGGVHIFDPRSRELRIVDQSQGLANNTVVSIQRDDEGLYWVGTYNGLSILSPDGRVMTNIGEAEGLSHREFNRYSSCKTSDGKLVFGTISGLNIIDVEQLKSQLSLDEHPRIYLLSVRYFREQGLQTLTKGPELAGEIVLPPENRYLQARFALSSYIQPERNQYAYKLEGMDEEWRYIGAEGELNLSNLPAGKYSVLIKGSDYRGIWSDQPVALDIHVREFFFRQAWFYVLCFALVTAIIFTWIRRLRSEKTRLEKEVNLRTTRIRKDKELIEQQAVELRQLNAMKNRFFTNISHELRTPITLISTPIEQILRTHGARLGAEVRRTLRLARKNAGKLLSLVEELLELSRIEAGKMALEKEPLELQPFCRQLFAAYQSSAGIKGIDYRLEFKQGNDLMVLADRNRLEKILNNLLGNALKFTSRGGIVQLAVGSRRLAGDEIELSFTVTDTGRGIPPEDLPHIFDRYFQTSRNEFQSEGGTGIGLALARELAVMIGGEIEVQSELGKGSSFTLRIPVQAIEKPAPDPGLTVDVTAKTKGIGTPQPIQSMSFGSPAVRRSGILIVEDHRDMQNLLQSLLTVDYHSIVANNGTEAWQMLLNESDELEGVELILSDVMMPGMSGYELLEKVKGHDRWRRLPVIMLTARAAEEDKLRALRMGVDDYLTKPFSPEELLTRVANLILNYRARKEFVESGIMTVNELSADQAWLAALEKQALTALDKKIDLTASLLAHTASLSERQLLRRLKTITGMTTIQYLREIKLQKARRLLENKSFRTIAEVAFACGFKTPGYFSSVYEKHFGKRPADYFEST